MLLGMVACGGSTGGSDESGADEYVNKYSDRPKSVTLCYYEGGYGVEWLRAVTADYMDNINQDVYISMKASTDNSVAREKISSQTGTYDLYYIEVDMFNRTNVLEELTSLLDMEVPGETGVKVRDKIDQKWLDYYEENGEYYQMPATNFMGWNWTYNKTLLDETLGEGNWKLPNTTDELFALGEELFNKDVFLTAFAGNDTTGGADYLRYCYEVWFAQMTGMEGFDNYFNCLYDNNGTYELAKEFPKNIEQNRTAIEKTYQVAQTLCTGQNGVEFMHSKSESLSFLDAQFLQYQGGFRGAADYPIAFYYNGASAEKEMGSYVEDGIIEDQDIRVMKMPVISAILERTPSISDDATLSAVVDYADGNADTLPAGVTEEDAAIVAEARSMMAELVCREFVITKTAQNKDEIKQFLAYLTSDRAQLIAAQQCNGLPVLNYGYVPTEEALGFPFSQFTKSVYDVLADATVVDIAKFDKPISVNLGLGWYKDSTTSGGSLSENLYTGQALTADEIYQSTINSYSGTWKDRVEQFLIQQGQ
jgi:ABC-type glycerol-3-phosphate transport system substrate-binding protein